MKYCNLRLYLVVLLSLFGWWTSTTTAWADGTKHYLAFASDRHGRTEAIGKAMGVWTSLPVEYVSMIGDMVGEKSGDAPAYDVSTVWNEVNAVFPSLTSDKFSIIWADHDAGYSDSEKLGVMKVPNNETSTCIYTDAEHNYYVYAINFYEMENVGTEAPEAFKAWVDGIDKSAVIIVLCHVPMHYIGNKYAGDNVNGTNWCDALNYAATGSVDGTEVVRNVVFFHGHFHTAESVQSGSSFLPATEHYWTPGETVAIQGTTSSESVDKTIQFTYVTAGYSRSKGSDWSTSPNNATLMTIDDTQLTFTKSQSGELSELGTVQRVAQAEEVYYTVTFESNGGTEVAPQQVKQGATVTKPADPTREGYTFDGWYADEALTVPYDFSQPVTATLTLYAKWSAGKCATPVLTFENGKVVCSCETENVAYVYEMALTGSSGTSTDGILTIGNKVVVSVKAVRDGWDDSDVATMEISPWQVGDVNGDGTITIADVTALVNIILEK